MTYKNVYQDDTLLFNHNHSILNSSKGDGHHAKQKLKNEQLLLDRHLYSADIMKQLCLSLLNNTVFPIHSRKKYYL